MKSKIKGTEVSEYPCLKQSFHTGKVVLFTKEKEGTVVNIGTDSTSWIGYYSDEWDMNNFAEFNGTIELTNN